jgi:FYVE, RhoGEF and PH domain containing 5/6
MHRESVISVASFDSLPEEGEAPVTYGIRNGLHGHGHGYIAPKRLGPGKGQIESPRRRTRRDVPKPADDLREAKRKKVIEEFYETEKAYVDGLELIYSVGYFGCLGVPTFVLTIG